MHGTDERTPLQVVCHHVEADLGRWTHSEWRPPARHPLSWVVERIWDFEGQVTDRRERLFPCGVIELIVQLDDRYHDVEGAGLTLTPPVCVTGMQLGPLVIEAPPRPCRVLGVRFHPPGAWAILGHPLSELTGLTTDLGAVMGTTAHELAERCHDAGGPVERVRRAVSWLCDRLDRSTTAPQVSPAVRHVADEVTRAYGAVRLATLREETGWSTARLAQAFLEQVGVTPKRYARIHRFRHALDLLRAPGANLSDVAVRTGYYDQPHMNAEFRDLAGLTPHQILTARHYPAGTSAPDG